MSDAEAPDIVEHESPVAFAATLERLTQAIARAGMTLFGTIDHAALARGVGLAMPSTTVLLYGNPRGGTPIMQANPRAALDLPLRVLVRERPDGGVLVGFHPVTALLGRAGVATELAAHLEPAQRLLVAALAP